MPKSMKPDRIDREINKALAAWEKEAYRPGAAIDGSGRIGTPKAGNGNQGGTVMSIEKVERLAARDPRVRAMKPKGY